MCWFYSVLNLLVISESKYLYLGGNNVRVVCESEKIQEYVHWRILVSDSRLVTCQKCHTCEAYRKLKGHES